MSSISFDNAWLLLLAVPLVVLFTVPFFIAVRKDNANGHNIASGIIHIVMAVIIAFVAAGTSVITTVTQTDVYVLADVSYSTSRNLDAVDGYIAELGKSLPNNSRMGVICFGRDYQLLTRLGERVKSVKQADVDDSATDIIGALDYAGSLFRDDVIKRIVVITDGKQTNESDSNAFKRQVDALADRKIHVDAIYIDANLRDGAREVQLTDVQFTNTTCLNRDGESVQVTIDCSCPETMEDGETVYVTEAVLTLDKDGEKYAEKTVYLSYGKNTASFDLPTDKAGTFDYELRISCEDDENLYNNKLAFSQTVSDEVSVLLITDKDEDYLALRSIYGENANIDPYYSYMADIPCSVEEICRYDEIVLSDVDVYELKNRDLFLHSLETAVSLFGKTLLTFGDTYVQNYTSGELKQLSAMLPVNYGASSDAPKLYTILIDTSSSMEYYPGNFDRAKRAAGEIVSMASENTMISLVWFNGDSGDFSATSDKDAVLEKIDGLTVAQSTDLMLGLQRAVKGMGGSGYSEKRVMLITDGIFVNDGVIEMITDMRNSGIYTGVLDVGRGNSVDTAGYKSTLEQIAKVGSGTAEMPNGIFLDISTETNLGDALKELPKYDPSGSGGMSFISVKRFNDDVLGGITDGEITGSFVNGVQYSAAKGNATTVLTVRYNKSGKPSEDIPLYSYWDYGNGRTASFTSKLSGDWTYNPEVRDKLFRNIMSVNLPSEKTDYPFLLDVETADGYASVTLTPETVRADAATTIKVTAPDGTVTEGTLAFGTLSFSYNLVTPAEGKYVIDITYQAFGQTFSATRIINVSYSSEYDSFALYDASVLHKAIGANGKVSEDGKLTIVNDESEIGLYNLSLAIPLLIVCVVLYAVDIAVRKLKWEDIRSFFKRGKKVK